MKMERSFLQQKDNLGDSRLENACGAFCVKYWHWHTSEKYPLDFAEQEKEILAVYDEIMFGSFADDLPQEYGILPDASNPLMIAKICKGTLMGDPNGFLALVEIMQNQAGDDVPIIKESMLGIDENRYAILIEGSIGEGYHYILVYRTNDGRYFYHDPANKTPLQLKNGFPVPGENIGEQGGAYKYVGAGILLPASWS